MSDLPFPTALVTNDAAILSGDTKRMHKIDVAILNEAGGRALSLADALAEGTTHVKNPEEHGARERYPRSSPDELIPLTPEMAQTLADAACQVSDACQQVALRLVNTAQASYIRLLRVDRGYSWRKIAAMVEPMLEPLLLPHELKYWSPDSNQLMGMALCERAAILRGENFLREPWN